MKTAFLIVLLLAECSSFCQFYYHCGTCVSNKNCIFVQTMEGQYQCLTKRQATFPVLRSFKNLGKCHKLEITEGIIGKPITLSSKQTTSKTPTTYFTDASSIWTTSNPVNPTEITTSKPNYPTTTPKIIEWFSTTHTPTSSITTTTNEPITTTSHTEVKISTYMFTPPMPTVTPHFQTTTKIISTSDKMETTTMQPSTALEITPTTNAPQTRPPRINMCRARRVPIHDRQLRQEIQLAACDIDLLFKVYKEVPSMGPNWIYFFIKNPMGNKPKMCTRLRRKAEKKEVNMNHLIY